MDINVLIKELEKNIKNDELILPTLPKVAMQVRNACDDLESTVTLLVDIISKDPALSARIVKYSNSAFMRRGNGQRIESLNIAISRIGLDQLRTIATAMAMEQLFISSHKIISEKISKTWKTSTEIAAMSTTFLKFYKDRVKTDLLQEEMLLKGLLYNIGALPILTEAERIEGDMLKENVLNYCINKYSNIIGYKILKSWHFSDSMQQTIYNWPNFNFKPEKVDYIDFIRLAYVTLNLADSRFDKESFYQDMLNKGIIEDIHLSSSNEFKDLYKNLLSAYS